MNDAPTFFRARAVAEQANADGASLDNVRERSQRAADSWAKMADRADRTRVMRAAREGGPPVLAGEDASQPIPPEDD
jgi:hypothetical protein